MGEKPAYAIVGGGYWARRMEAILRETHRVACIEQSRSAPRESAEGYRSRLSQLLEDTGTQMTWICVPPGPHIPLMIEAALQAGLHVIVEKPWLSSRDESERLRELASRKKRIVGVHYQYCLLAAVEAWRRDLDSGTGLEFSGCFNVSGGNRLGIDALDNLGTHLLAISKYAVPQARLSQIQCGYGTADQRKVWVEKAGKVVASIDFLENREPIIQRFIDLADRAVHGASFPFGIDFALQVGEAIRALKFKLSN